MRWLGPKEDSDIKYYTIEHKQDSQVNISSDYFSLVILKWNESTFICNNINFYDVSIMLMQGDEWQLLTDNQIDPEEASYMSKFAIVLVQ